MQPQYTPLVRFLMITWIAVALAIALLTLPVVTREYVQPERPVPTVDYTEITIDGEPMDWEPRRQHDWAAAR